MSENNKQVTIRFESSAANPEVDSNILMSGPVELFAVLDVIEDLQDDELITNVQIEIDSGKYNPIVYVENVTGFSDSPRYRGAYFRYDGLVENEAVWTEILLGTHSHSNMDVLEKLSSVNIPDSKEASVMVLNSDGTLGFEALPSGLPELPDYIKERLKEREELDLIEPTEYEDVHLDAHLSLLNDSHKYVDSDGNVIEIGEVGNCLELYRSLIRDGKYLILDPETFNLTIDDHMSGLWLKMSAELICYDISNNFDNVRHPVVKGNTYYFSDVKLPDKVESRDRVFIFNDSNLIEQKYYTQVIGADKKTATIAINRLCPLVQDSELHKFTILIVKDCTTVEFFENTFAIEMSSETPRITLDKINAKLTQAYIEGELSKKPLVPHLYLATDSDGNIHWENTLIPNQTFFAETQDITYEEALGKVEDRNGQQVVKVSFKNTNYNLESDFMLLIVENGIDFTSEREVLNKENKVNFYIPLDQFYGDNDVNNDEKTNITLIIIRNSSKGSIAQELHENFLTREEAVSILTRGTISLSDYVKRTELGKFSRVGHKHGEYAPVAHDHDYRYANFHHTHPEVYATIIKLLGSVDENGVIDSEVLDEWVAKLQDNEKIALHSILREVGFKQDSSSVYYIDDVKVKLTNDLVGRINEEIELYPNFAQKLEPGATVYDALLILTDLFKHDTVTATQVYLTENIRVKHPIGGAVAGKIYKKQDLENGESGTTLEEIIMDLLNPYWDLDKVREEMTPVKEFTIINWYKPIYDEIGNVIDFYPLEEGSAVNSIDNPTNTVLYFSVDPKNVHNDDCEAILTTRDGVEILQTIALEVFTEIEGSILELPYQEYENRILYKFENTYDKLIIKWYANTFEKDEIRDNYDFEVGTLNTDDTKPIIIENLTEVFEVEYPDMIIGATDSVDHITKKDFKGDSVILEEAAQKKLLMKGDTVPLDITIGSSTRVIFALYEENELLSFDNDISIVEKMSGMEIKYFFTSDEQHESISLYGQKYLVRYYEITTDVIPDINLIFKVKGE